MICFQFVSLKYWQQHRTVQFAALVSCDLLSICIFEILATTAWRYSPMSNTLWFAFNLYLWNIGNNSKQFIYSVSWVVICFQFVSLKYWQQHSRICACNVLVVICFQFVSLKYWQQHTIVVILYYQAKEVVITIKKMKRFLSVFIIDRDFFISVSE